MLCILQNLVRGTGSQKTIEQPFVCAHLKVVNIECIKVDEVVHKILKILSTCGILRERISIKDKCFSSHCKLSFPTLHAPYAYAIFVLNACSIMSAMTPLKNLFIFSIH
jgi:hypothetical protein